MPAEPQTYACPRGIGQCFELKRHGRFDGLALEAKPGAHLDDLGHGSLVPPLSQAGYLVLEGFEGNLDAFTRLVRRCSARTSLDPARSLDGAAQKVDAGTAAVGLHCENGNSPFQPTLCWFYCVRAARSGSETTVCDGVAAWRRLSPDARACFGACSLRYSRHVPERLWRRMAFIGMGQSIPLEQITLAHLRSLVDLKDATELREDRDGTLFYEVRRPAAARCQFGGELAFANSLSGPSYNYESPEISFDDGSAIGDWLLQEVKEATAATTDEVQWRDGMVVLIDNTRVMHGRRAIVDTDRTIFNALSYLT